MVTRQCVWAAVDMVIDIAAENGIKYRRGDFEIIEEAVDIVTESELERRMGKNLVARSVLGVTVALRFDFKRTARKLRERKDRFADCAFCSIGNRGIYFMLPFEELCGEAPLFDFSEEKRNLEKRGHPSAWVDKVVDRSDKYAVFERNGKPHYKSECPYYEGYWLRGGLGSVQCAGHDGLIPGLQWDKFCSKCYEDCRVFHNKTDGLNTTTEDKKQKGERENEEGNLSCPS